MKESLINKRALGLLYEEKVAKYLEDNGYKIIERNFFTRIGEIDIVAQNDGYICFIEVKYREENALASGLYAVDKKKQKTIYNVAKIYMARNYIKEDTACRFDVVSVEGNKIEIIKNAFP
ncbi:MAG: YraN family protein [Lachnospiraceae bacterium]|nr:YraN family protein [Lachnospiraceae bacterium]